MDFGSINWLAVIASVVFSMISGSIWYNRKTFFPIWWKGIGKSENDQPGANTPMALTWGLTVLGSLLQSIFMAVLVSAIGKLYGGATLSTGILTGLVLWAGFVAPTYLVNKMFAGHGLKIWAIEVGNHLLNFLVFGAILGAWH